MGRMYTVEFSAASLLAADTDIDWFELTPATNKPLKLWGLFMNQTSDLGDANEESLTWQVIRGHTTSGSGGTSPTVRALDRSGATAGFTAEAVNDVVATVGTVHNLHTGGWNIRMEKEFWWLPELRPTVSAADTTIVIRQLDTVNDDLTGVSGTLYVEEEG